MRRDYSHPSIVTWVPLNESWGVQHIASDERMVHYARSLVELPKALDPTRPVVSNDGWEQVDTDIVAIHDYEAEPDVVAERYASRAAVDELVRTVGPAGRLLVLSGDVTEAPIMLTEFGGISFDEDATQDAWGTPPRRRPTTSRSASRRLLDAVRGGRALAGFCYTQLTDTLQETNGLVRSDPGRRSSPSPASGRSSPDPRSPARRTPARPAAERHGTGGRLAVVDQAAEPDAASAAPSARFAERNPASKPRS